MTPSSNSSPAPFPCLSFPLSKPRYIWNHEDQAWRGEYIAGEMWENLKTLPFPLFQDQAWWGDGREKLTFQLNLGFELFLEMVFMLIGWQWLLSFKLIKECPEKSWGLLNSSETTSGIDLLQDLAEGLGKSSQRSSAGTSKWPGPKELLSGLRACKEWEEKRSRGGVFSFKE